MAKHTNPDASKRLYVVTVTGGGERSTYSKTYLVAAPNRATVSSMVRQHFTKNEPAHFQATVHVHDPIELHGDYPVLTTDGTYVTLDDVVVFYIK